jgi:CRP/FNR family transcriptional regulator, cyclic AMP receptor protein
MAKDNRADLLGCVPLFEGLTRRELGHVINASKEVEFPAGRTIVSEGDPGTAFHMILKGKARVTVRGRTKTKLGPGDYFGEMSLIDRGKRSATVVAETPVRTLSLVSWNFLPLLDEVPSMAKKMLIIMSQRLRLSERGASHTH